MWPGNSVPNFNIKITKVGRKITFINLFLRSYIKNRYIIHLRLQSTLKPLFHIIALYTEAFTPTTQQFTDAILKGQRLPCCLELCPSCFHDLKIWFQSTASKTTFQWPKLVGNNLGPDWNCTVMLQNLPIKLLQAVHCSRQLTFQSALVLWFDNIEVPLMEIRNWLVLHVCNA